MIKLILAVIALIVIVSALRAPKEDYHSNWSFLLAGFKFSTKEFYSLIRKEMLSHDISELSFDEVNLKTGNIFSSSRVYLRIRWLEYHYDLCFAPFGDGCFVSWWLVYETSSDELFFTKIPFIGEWMKKGFYRKTYYKIDTASMFMTYAHNSVLKVIDEITKNTSIRLDEIDRKPILNDIFHR